MGTSRRSNRQGSPPQRQQRRHTAADPTTEPFSRGCSSAAVAPRRWGALGPARRRVPPEGDWRRLGSSRLSTMRTARRGSRRVGTGSARRFHGAPDSTPLPPAARHRLAMCALAAEGVDGVTVCDWEASQPGWTRTLEVMRRTAAERPGVRAPPPRVALRLMRCRRGCCWCAALTSSSRSPPRACGRMWTRLWVSLGSAWWCASGCGCAARGRRPSAPGVAEGRV